MCYPGSGAPKPAAGIPTAKNEDPMHRSRVNKRTSARSFNKKAHRTHPKNVMVMRGGYRL